MTYKDQVSFCSIVRHPLMPIWTSFLTWDVPGNLPSYLQSQPQEIKIKNEPKFIWENPFKSQQQSFEQFHKISLQYKNHQEGEISKFSLWEKQIESEIEHGYWYSLYSKAKLGDFRKWDLTVYPLGTARQEGIKSYGELSQKEGDIPQHTITNFRLQSNSTGRKEIYI